MHRNSLTGAVRPADARLFQSNCGALLFLWAAKGSLVAADDERLTEAVTKVGFDVLASRKYLALTYMPLVDKVKLSNVYEIPTMTMLRTIFDMELVAEA